MSADFAELDYRQTSLGELILRRRRIPSLEGLEIFEIKLGDAFLMSSLFHDVEVALADLGLDSLNAPSLDVVVGGLGLGYTAAAALKHPAVSSLLVVEVLDAVSFTAISLPSPPHRSRASTPKRLDENSTRSSSTSTTRPTISCIRGMPRFIRLRDCADSSNISIRKASSPSGRTIRPTRMF